jgi:hypothetical protein
MSIADNFPKLQNDFETAAKKQEKKRGFTRNKRVLSIIMALQASRFK